jgi:long-chain acyl-CoA synthetase
VKSDRATPAVGALSRRFYNVVDGYAIESPGRPAPIEGGRVWNYRELDSGIGDGADSLTKLGVRRGGRLVIVIENSIALARVLLAASHIEAWAILVNPRLPPRELNQIRDHGGAKRVFLTVGVSGGAEGHALRYEAHTVAIGLPRQIAVTALNENTAPELVEDSSRDQVSCADLHLEHDGCAERRDAEARGSSSTSSRSRCARSGELSGKTKCNGRHRRRRRLHR